MVAFTQVEWASVFEEGVDTVIAYARTSDHDSSAYQSSKTALSDLSTSTEAWDCTLSP